MDGALPAIQLWPYRSEYDWLMDKVRGLFQGNHSLSDKWILTFPPYSSSSNYPPAGRTFHVNNPLKVNDLNTGAGRGDEVRRPERRVLSEFDCRARRKECLPCDSLPPSSAVALLRRTGVQGIQAFSREHQALTRVIACLISGCKFKWGE